MGGNLFNLPRLPRADYLERENELRVYLEQKLGAGFRIPRFYASKPDFGDDARVSWFRPRTLDSRL